MRAVVWFADAEEAAQIKAGLKDPETRALVRVMGVLSGLRSDGARRRVLDVVSDLLKEEAKTAS